MAFEQSDLDTLDQAIASGVQSVTYADGRAVTYRNMADLQRARDMVERALKPKPLIGTIKARYNDGLGS